MRRVFSVVKATFNPLPKPSSTFYHQHAHVFKTDSAFVERLEADARRFFTARAVSDAFLASAPSSRRKVEIGGHGLRGL
jgi:hypothetical protein